MNGFYSKTPKVGASVVAGVVLFHGNDKRIVSMEGPVYGKDFKALAVVYTGKSIVSSHI
jgi:hypothetical protein